MMLSKPKPSGEESPAEKPVEPSSTNDREAEIARRLALLGDIGVEEPKEEEVKAPSPTPFPAPASKEVATLPVEQPTLVMKDEKVGSSLAPVDIPAPSVPVPSKMKPEPTPAATPTAQAATAAAKPTKSALLERIMAAQDRAKQVQLKQASQQNSVEAEKDKMMRALTGITAAEKKPDPLPPMTMAPPAPVMKAPRPPPPSFDIFEQQMRLQPTVTLAPAPPAPPALSFTPPAPPMAPPPPAFDDVAQQVFQQSNMASAPAMTAPDADLLGGDFQGIMPMAPPPVSAPSFDQAMQQLRESSVNTTSPNDDADLNFVLDESGMQLSPDEWKRMVEEQRAIMEHIEREARNNKASEAAIRADAFASRMTGTVNVTQEVAETSEAPTSVGWFSASEIEEQCRILQEIEQTKRTSSSTQQASRSNQIQIGDGQTAHLHGQEKTQQSIKDGSAQIVLCLNCNNWMQVAGSAKLMLCPVCSVVTPVVQQEQIMTKEEILQMEEDRKLAEALQAEENVGEDRTSDYPGLRRRTTAHGTASRKNSKSWWDTISDALVSVGVSTEPSESNKRSTENNDGTRQRTLHSAVTGDEGSDRIGLLSGDNDGDNDSSSAHISQSQPLLSCVVDSISNTAAAAGSYLAGEAKDEVHGVDTTSLLAVPNTGRDKTGSEGNCSL